MSIKFETDNDYDAVADSLDAFPGDPTQWSDSDGDGYGDNPDGNDPDAFPVERTQWQDADGDGFGDNPYGESADEFPQNPNEWFDSDGDGSGDNSDAFPVDITQWLDTDGDGYGDNKKGNNPDVFPEALVVFLSDGIIKSVLIRVVCGFGLRTQTDKKTIKMSASQQSQIPTYHMSADFWIRETKHPPLTI